MSGERSKLTLIIPPKPERKAPYSCNRLTTVGWPNLAHEFISITEIFEYSLVPCILLRFSSVFPKVLKCTVQSAGAQLRS